QEIALLPHPPQIECQMDKMMQSLLALEDAHDRLRISTYSPKYVAGLTIEDFLVGPSKLGMGFPPMQSEPYEPGSIQLVPPEVYIREKIRIDFSNFDYGKKKLWMFQDIIYSLEFIKALPIYYLLDNCSQRVLAASALACTNFTASYYSFTHNSDRTYYPDGFTMTWSKEMLA
ncbi:hypothetical protein PMAYCL1PPCAC_32653, partial [Pristionchus mayeri]